MKRSTLISALIAFSLVFALKAHANVFTNPEAYGGSPNPSHYKLQFDGFTYVHSNSSESLLNGAASPIKDSNSLHNEDGSLRHTFAGENGEAPLSLTGILYATNIIQTASHESAGSSPSLYNGGNSPGAYVAVMKNMLASSSAGSIDVEHKDPSMTGTLFFAGGTVEWYYLPEYTADDLASLEYRPESADSPGGFYMNFFGTREEERLELSRAERLGSFNLSPGEADSEITLSYKEDALNAKINLFPELSDNSLFDSNLYGTDSYDSHISANLDWDDGKARFSTSGSARMSVTATATPEPAAALLTGMGMLTLALIALRRRRR